MRILKVIHGYPPLYNAGSEVYSQMLCHGLSANHEVHVFTREENPFVSDFSLRQTCDDVKSAIKLHLINIPGDKYRYRYRHSQVDSVFKQLLERIKPDIVHIGHLNHLSTSLIYEVAKKKIPLVYTLHDYWLMCPRGQFIQRNPPPPSASWSLCDGQVNEKCAKNCYAGYFSGAEKEIATDAHYWTDWVDRRMSHIRDVTQHINYFIAPSRYLYNRYADDFALSPQKMVYLDYGFDLERLTNRTRTANEPFTFGYIGTHIPAKGIDKLITAFGLLKGHCKLRIWGRPRPQNTDGLRTLAASLPADCQEKIEWLPEYRNENITHDVFNHVDCIVVPSIWMENSPLVIHEALQVRIPVITANAGGMAEYIKHEQNGLLFEHLNSDDLAVQMQRFVDHPQLARDCGNQGYLQSDDRNIPSLSSQVTAIEEIYDHLLN